jgi:DNA-directed RNA polymerase subunit beta'
MNDEQKQQALIGVYGQVQKFFVDNTYKSMLAKDNPFALQVVSRARGNPAQLAALMTTPGTYTDAYGNVIPVFVRHSYAEGLSPHEYWAGTYGARQGVISTKFATRDAGDLGKQFNQAAMRMVVTEDDCGTASGIPVPTDDKDMIGSVLARQAGKYPSGSVVSKEILQDLASNDKFEEIVVRSPLTCDLSQGVCKHCTGLREGGVFPKIGDHVGINAASALAERIAQGSLNVKHSGGMSKGDGDKVYAGFDVIEQLFQVPKTFPHRAAVATRDGRVDRIEDAAQGGQNVYVDDEVHYVLPESRVSVKEGDRVEAGDQLSTGILNPREVVQYKGIGEGRRYFTQRAAQAFRESGYSINRRNLEVLVRGMMDHAVVDDPGGSGDYLPGDIVSYNALARGYRPRPEAQQQDVDQAVGQYLEQPILHHTIGTRITRGMATQLKRFGHKRVLTHAAQPTFQPYMVGLRAVPQQEKDWMAQLGSSHLQKNLLKNVQRGAESSTHGLHPVPGLAKGVEFGQTKEVGY